MVRVCVTYGPLAHGMVLAELQTADDARLFSEWLCRRSDTLYAEWCADDMLRPVADVGRGQNDEFMVARPR